MHTKSYPGTVTVAHFAEFYLMRGVTAGDTMEGASLAEPALARQSLWKATAHFLDISLQGNNCSSYYYCIYLVS